MRSEGNQAAIDSLTSDLWLLTIALFALQTDDVVVEELRGRNHFVPVTLVREKGTYGTVTVHFQVRRSCNIHEPKHSAGWFHPRGRCC